MKGRRLGACTALAIAVGGCGREPERADSAAAPAPVAAAPNAVAAAPNAVAAAPNAVAAAPNAVAAAPASPSAPPAPAPAPSAPPAPSPSTGTEASAVSADDSIGCAVRGSPQRVLVSEARAAVVGLDSGFVVAGYVVDGAAETLHVARVRADGREPRGLARLSVTPPIAPTQIVPPGLAVTQGGALAVAYVDGANRLQLARVGLASPATPASTLLLAEAVDTRFPPAVASSGARTFVAYTKPGNPQHVEVVTVEAGRVANRVDVTPHTAGAVSPSFVHGATTPTLVFVDPRGALSLAHAVTFGADGAPSAAESLQPIVGLVAPARLVAARDARDLHLAFLAYGAGNQMGVYLLDVHANSITPAPLVEPVDFNRLWVDLLGADGGTVAVSVAPRGGVVNAERDVVVRYAGARGLGEPLVIRAAAGSVIYPALARDGSGQLAVTYGTSSGVFFAPLSCGDAPPHPG